MLLRLGSPKTTYAPNNVPEHYQLQCFSLSSRACLAFEVSGRLSLGLGGLGCAPGCVRPGGVTNPP